MLITTIKNITLFFFGAAVAGLAFLYFLKLNGKVVSFIRTKCPRMVQSYIRNRQIKRIEKQMVDCVDMLANCLKAGLSLQQAFAMVSQDSPSPIREEFAFIINQIKMGKNLEDALIELKERVPLDDVHILVESILVLRQTGGNLVVTFASIADTIRERQKVSGKIRVLTAQGLTEAAVILILPFALGLGLYFVAGWYIEPLITTSLGWLLIFFALCLQTLGALWLKKIVTIKV